MKMTIKVSELKPGDYVIAAKATVQSVDTGGPITIVEFTDKTATAPIPSQAPVEIERDTDRLGPITPGGEALLKELFGE